jgi:uncharacterized protein (TIGR02722 family)
VNKKVVVAVVLTMAAAGCAAGPIVRYEDPMSGQMLSSDFSSTDLQRTAEAMVDSLLVFAPVVEAIQGRRPVLLIDRVHNKTMQHIDTESITDSIRTRLIKSGRFQFVDRTTDEAAIDELRFQQESGLVDPARAVEMGRQYGAEYLLTANLSEIVQSNDRVRDVYYKFTMNLKNLKTGILEWAEEKEIRKSSTRRTFGL